ncbi:hypothetical protein DFR24_1019 [Panacagrimonas perspica]|uniref:Uncharacterized protein n=1 Tax=Panacagrimonas perspica TaxID=381431 RepID=A0A4R7PC13_9GAMM|nr:hypothetical protein DFR24_1019 [Panacagrimonas perspica]
MAFRFGPVSIQRVRTGTTARSGPAPATSAALPCWSRDRPVAGHSSAPVSCLLAPPAPTPTRLPVPEGSCRSRKPAAVAPHWQRKPKAPRNPRRRTTVRRAPGRSRGLPSPAVAARSGSAGHNTPQVRDVAIAGAGGAARSEATLSGGLRRRAATTPIGAATALPRPRSRRATRMPLAGRDAARSLPHPIVLPAAGRTSPRNARPTRGRRPSSRARSGWQVRGCCSWRVRGRPAIRSFADLHQWPGSSMTAGSPRAVNPNSDTTRIIAAATRMATGTIRTRNSASLERGCRPVGTDMGVQPRLRVLTMDRSAPCHVDLHQFSRRNRLRVAATGC